MAIFVQTMDARFREAEIWRDELPTVAAKPRQALTVAGPDHAKTVFDERFDASALQSLVLSESSHLSIDDSARAANVHEADPDTAVRGR